MIVTATVTAVATATVTGVGSEAAEAHAAGRVPIGGAMKDTHGALNSCFFQAWDIDAFTDAGDFAAAADSLLSGPHRRGRRCHSTLPYAVLRRDARCTRTDGGDGRDERAAFAQACAAPRRRRATSACSTRGCAARS